MLPIRDDNPTSRTAWVTLAIIALNVVAFLFWEPTFAGSSQQGQVRQETFFFCHALIPWEVIHHTNLASGGGAAQEAGRGRSAEKARTAERAQRDEYDAEPQGEPRRHVATRLGVFRGGVERRLCHRRHALVGRGARRPPALGPRRQAGRPAGCS